MLAGRRSTLDRDFRSGAPPRGERAMSPEFIAIIVVGLSNAAALVFPWGLHCGAADPRERMARWMLHGRARFEG